MLQKGVALNLDAYTQRLLSVVKAGAKLEERAIHTKYNNNAEDTSPAAPWTMSVLARLVLQPHHIIAWSKRRVIANPAQDLDLGG